jgi:hypothetical protein
MTPGGLVHFVQDLWRGLAPATERERALAGELRARFRALPVLGTEGVSDSEAEWRRNMNELRAEVLRGDPRRFLTWPVIRRTMVVRRPRYLKVEYDHLRGLPDWADRWAPAVRENPAGRPFRYPRYPESSGNLLHHAYHVARFEAAVGEPVTHRETIVEFGGGYGSMGRLIRNLGFRGRYIIFDLPSFSALQRYYLQAIDLVVAPDDGSATADNGNHCVSDPERLARMLTPTPAKALFIATWSLSETPPEVRQRITPLVRGFDAFLIAYQAAFGEMDNVAWFRTWREAIPGVAWQCLPIAHLPGRHDYLFGRRAGGGSGQAATTSR